jgi:hypothetical protein
MKKGKFELTKERIKNPPCVMPSLCEFWDYSGGHCLKNCEMLKVEDKLIELTKKMNHPLFLTKPQFLLVIKRILRDETRLEIAVKGLTDLYKDLEKRLKNLK